MSLVSELNRRNVIRVAVAYVVAAWIIAQVADLVLENIGAPRWVMQTLLLLLVIGFFVTAVFAWAYEVTPDGIKRDADAEHDEATSQRTGSRLNLVTFLLVILAAGLLAFERLGPSPARPEPPASAEVNHTNAGNEREAVTEQAAAPESHPIVAVLPFKVIGSEDGDFLAVGLHDDLLTRLAKLEAFRVISRTSMMEYADTTKNIRQIGDELGARYILEGGIQSRGNRVRINAQLIDAPTDEHVWAETYDRELTAANLFDIQSELAYAIAGQLQTALSTADEALVGQIPTRSLAAYAAYLRGLEIRDTGGHNSKVVSQAVEAFKEATKLDPAFALAWAQLSIEYSRQAQGSIDTHTRELAASARARAQQLEPDLYEAEIARAVYLYRAEYEYQEALDVLVDLESRRTLTAQALLLKSFLQRRLGDFEGAYETIARARELDPRSQQIIIHQVNMAWENDNCDAARQHAETALALAPDVVDVRTNVAFMELQCNGDGERANALMRDAEFDGFFQMLIADLAASAARDWQRVVDINTTPLPQAGTHFRIMGELDSLRALRELGRDDEAEARLAAIGRELTDIQDNPALSGTRRHAMTMAQYSAQMGNVTKTRYWVDEAKRRELVQGKNDKAGQVALLMYYANIYTTVGLYDEALSELRISLGTPGGDRFAMIEVQPAFDPLRDLPGYAALRDEFGNQ